MRSESGGAARELHFEEKSGPAVPPPPAAAAAEEKKGAAAGAGGSAWTSVSGGPVPRPWGRRPGDRGAPDSPDSEQEEEEQEEQEEEEEEEGQGKKASAEGETRRGAQSQVQQVPAAQEPLEPSGGGNFSPESGSFDGSSFGSAQGHSPRDPFGGLACAPFLFRSFLFETHKDLVVYFFVYFVCVCVCVCAFFLFS